jgi:hypothetical protein
MAETSSEEYDLPDLQEVPEEYDEERDRQNSTFITPWAMLKLGLVMGFAGCFLILPGFALTLTVLGAPIGIPMMFLGCKICERHVKELVKV